MGEMQRLTISDIGELYDGPHATPKRRDDGPYFLNISSLKSGRLDLAASDHVSEEDYTKWTRRVTPQGGDLLFSYETRIGEAALMPDGVRACLGRRMALLRPDQSVVVPRFLIYYYLSPEFQKVIESHTIHGATVNRIGLATMSKWEISIPDLSEQQAIAEVLGAIDDKIAANDQVITKLDELAAAEYEKAIRTGARHVTLNEIAQFHNKRRIPLSIKERDIRVGTVPYYGAAGRLGSVDEALFDEKLVLLGEDGTVTREDDRPVVQYIWGPAWVNNHAHVLTGMTISTETLRFAVARPTVAHLVTGAVQPKLSMGNLKKLVLEIPTNLTALELTTSRFSALTRAVTEQNQVLYATRDELLPLLLSGTVRVRDAEKVVEEVV